jgi:hypothetical protein
MNVIPREGFPESQNFRIAGVLHTPDLGKEVREQWRDSTSRAENAFLH